MDPGEAERRFAARLEEAGLPLFASATHHASLDVLEIRWEHAVTLFMDLTREDLDEPIGDDERAVILGLAPCCDDCAPIDVYVPGSPGDPRTDTSIPGIEIHRVRRSTPMTSPPSTASRSRRLHAP